MMSRVRTAVLVGLLGGTIAGTCAAKTSAPTAAMTTAERLQTLYPATRFGAVQTTPWPGVFEVVMGRNLAYVDASGQYFLFGHLYDMKSQRDLTAERQDAIARIDFAGLPLTDALKEVRGTGARMLAIFSDPDCPYCRRLEKDQVPHRCHALHLPDADCIVHPGRAARPSRSGAPGSGGGLARLMERDEARSPLFHVAGLPAPASIAMSPSASASASPAHRRSLPPTVGCSPARRALNRSSLARTCQRDRRKPQVIEDVTP